MAMPEFNPVPVRERTFGPASMLEAAKLSLKEAERFEANAEEQRSRHTAAARSSAEAMRDELLLANVQASIAVAEALTADKQPDPDAPSKLKGYDYAREEAREPEGSLDVDLGEIQCMPLAPQVEIHVHDGASPDAVQTAIETISRNVDSALSYLGCSGIPDAARADRTERGHIARAEASEALIGDLIEWAEGKIREAPEGSLNNSPYSHVARTIEQKAKEAGILPNPMDADGRE